MMGWMMSMRMIQSHHHLFQHQSLPIGRLDGQGRMRPPTRLEEQEGEEGYDDHERYQAL
jgi:hypothetical protein